MSSDRPSSSHAEHEQDPISLEITALEGAMNAFMKRGFETLDEGIPEHLYILLASFSEHVPKDDLRRRATLELIENSFFVTNEHFLYRNEKTDQEKVRVHQTSLAELLDLLREPWQAVDVVRMMHAAVGEEEYRRRAWKKAFTFNVLDQDSTLRNEAQRGPGLKTLFYIEGRENNEPILQDPSVTKISPEEGTRRPPNKGHGWKASLSRRLKHKKDD